MADNTRQAYNATVATAHHLRFHTPHLHLNAPFGSDWFGRWAERFARWFGTPQFLLGQTAAVGTWILLNALGITRFDVYPFILLNLAFSLQAAYAAPLILLAQTRQAERDKVHSEADAQHREAIAAATEQRQAIAEEQGRRILELIEQNTRLTELTTELSRRIETLTLQVHGKIVGMDDHRPPTKPAS